LTRVKLDCKCERVSFLEGAYDSVERLSSKRRERERERSERRDWRSSAGE
jgi:hypothetical protein